jgi:hypothetical protein
MCSASLKKEIIIYIKFAVDANRGIVRYAIDIAAVDRGLTFSFN